jgi:hypothetical protein
MFLLSSRTCYFLLTFQDIKLTPRFSIATWRRGTHNHGIRWRWVLPVASRSGTFTQRWTGTGTFHRRLGGSQSRSGRGGEQKRSPPPLGLETQLSVHSQPGTMIQSLHTYVLYAFIFKNVIIIVSLSPPAARNVGPTDHGICQISRLA